jgi:hypothetical protein
MTRSISEAALAIAQSPELALIAKGTIVMAAALLAAGLARSSRASVRHVVLTAAFGVMLLLPLAAATAPGLTLAVDVPARVTAQTAAAASMPEPALTAVRTEANVAADAARVWKRPSIGTILRVVWAAGALAMLA